MSISLNVKYKARDGYEVELSEAIVKDALAKGNVPVTSKDIYLFEKYCEAKKLNPFVGDVYLVKYKADKDADFIMSKSYLLKTLKSLGGYQWHKAGILVAEAGEGRPKLVKLEGTYYMQGLQELVGGWAEISIDDVVVYHSVGLAEFNRGRSTWNQIPAVMIRKVALSQLCDDVSPSDFEGMYLEEEVTMTQETEHSSGVANLRASIARLGTAEEMNLAKTLTDFDALKAVYDTIIKRLEVGNVNRPAEVEP
jgi:phage recombination protein Bet